jgi:cation:H+ antiporter
VADVVLLLASFALILAGAELFTNGVEWMGRHLNLAEGAVGSVLAAVGTALPETMIPLVAILFGGHGAATDEIGIGAILGAPFMLATLAMFVTGAAVLALAGRRASGRHMPVNPEVVGHDVAFFVVAYAVAAAAALVPLELWFVRPLTAVVLGVLYISYVRGHLTAERGGDESELAALRFHRLDVFAQRADPAVPRLRVILLQVAVAGAAIIVGAVAFVDVVGDMSRSFGLAPAIVALVVAPIATELPEKFNSVIWIRGGKDTLAMGNITGAMVFQACIPTMAALLFAPASWAVTGDSALAFASVLIAFISTAVVFLPMRRRGRLDARGLLAGGACYLAYLGLVAGSLGGAA